MTNPIQLGVIGHRGHLSCSLDTQSKRIFAPGCTSMIQEDRGSALSHPHNPLQQADYDIVQANNPWTRNTTHARCLVLGQHDYLMLPIDIGPLELCRFTGASSREPQKHEHLTKPGP